MLDSLQWNPEAFGGTAALWPGRINLSNSFRATDPATGEPTTWNPGDLPQMEIPGIPEPVTAALDVSTGLCSFVLSAAESDAAIAAGRMWWVEAGQRLGVIRVMRQ